MAKRAVKKGVGKAKRAPRPNEAERIARAKARWLSTFRKAGNRMDSCAAAGISRSGFYRWIAVDPAFGDEVQMAEEERRDRLEDEAVRRAMEGSDTMLIFMLKTLRRQQFGDRLEVQQQGVMDLRHHDVVDRDVLRRMSPDELENARTTILHLLGEGGSDVSGSDRRGSDDRVVGADGRTEHR